MKTKLNKYYNFQGRPIFWTGKGLYGFNKNDKRYFVRCNTLEDAEFYGRHFELIYVQDEDLTPSTMRS